MRRGRVAIAAVLVGLGVGACTQEPTEPVQGGPTIEIAADTFEVTAPAVQREVGGDVVNVAYSPEPKDLAFDLPGSEQVLAPL